MLITRTLKVIVRLRFNVTPCRRLYSNLKVLYFGTDNFSLPSLRLLSEVKLSRLEVVTSFKAKNNPVKAFAEKNGIKVYDWPALLEGENFTLCRQFDLGLVVSFGHLIPEEIINSFRGGMLNVHASLLPKYRGASPIIYAIRNGDKETGVSIMMVKPRKFDVGEVLATRRVEIAENVLMPELHFNLATAGADLLVSCIKDLKRFEPMEQDSSKASYAPKITHEFCEVRWNEMSATEVFNLYRSIYSFKHVTTTFNGESAKLIEIATPDGTQPNPLVMSKLLPGRAVFCKKSKKLLVMCADSNFIEIRQLTIGKKKAMSAADFNNGFLRKCSEPDRGFQ